MIPPVRELVCVAQHLVPVLHDRRKANDFDAVRNGLSQTQSRRISGFVVIRAEEHLPNIPAFREKAVKGFAGHAAEGDIAPLHPFVRVQADEGKQINRRFKYEQLIAASAI